MSYTLTYPRTRREAEWVITKRHHSSRRGVMSDWPRSDIPLDGVYESDNVILFGSRKEVRSGTRLLSASHANLPTVADNGVADGSSISASKSGSTITISAGYQLSSSNVGDYFYWPADNARELILSIVEHSNTCVVNTSDTHSATTTGKMQQEVNAHIWDKVNKKLVVLLGTKIYYTTYEATVWTEAYCISNIAPANSKSIMWQYGENIYLWNSNGTYVVRMNVDVPTVDKLNNQTVETIISDIAENDNRIFGRRYTCTMCQMLGSYYTDSYEGNTVIQESSPWDRDDNGKDYAELFMAYEPSTSTPRLLQSLQVPYEVISGEYCYSKEYTHYRLYGTKNIGQYGLDEKTGIGNNPELFIHIADIPIIKSYVVSIESGTCTATSGVFDVHDTSNYIYLDDGTQVSITGYVSSTVLTVEDVGTYTNVGAVIGTTEAFVFSQSGNTVTAERGTPFDGDSIGKRIFASDGSLILITAYTDSTHVTVADSTTRSSLGGGIIVSPSANSNINIFNYLDMTGDDTLSTRISKYWCKNRFLEPLPNCNVGVVVDGFLISAVKGGSVIYQTQLANETLAGYYDPEFQIDTVQDSIQALRVYKNILSAICSQSTISWPTDTTATDSRPDVGLSTTFLAQKKVVDYNIGTMFPESIVAVHEGVDILFTNNCEIRLFDGKDYGRNIVEGKLTKEMRKFQPIGAASYDSFGGYYLWGTNGSLTSINSVNRLPFPDVCWRFSIKEEQGVIGGIKITGDAWLQPPNGVHGLEIIDGSDRSMQVVFDNVTGKYYWISTYNGPTGSGLSKTFVDKDDTTGTGTEISWSLSYGADTGNLMKYDIRHERSNLTINPYNPANADESGYDSEGYRDGLEIDFYAYKKSDSYESAYSTAKNITKDGDIVFDETPQDKAVQIKISGNRSECIISELVNYYTSFEQAAVPNKREMTEGDYQENLSAPTLWLTRNASLYKNLATGTSITGTPTGVTGVDGKSNSAFQISAALSTISVSLSSGTLLFWADGTVTVTIGGNSVALSSVGTSGSWTLYYATGITETGVLILIPSSTKKIEDVRAYNSEIDSDTRTYLYNDMVLNNGDNTLPIW